MRQIRNRMSKYIKVCLLFGLGLFAASAVALIDPSMSDPTTREGWKGVGFPVDDFVPWSLQLDSKEIAEQDGRYLVVFGYLVVSPNSIVLFPTADAARSGSLTGALILTSTDSPPIRWLFRNVRLLEGYYAVGGLFSRNKSGQALGHFTKVRFAMQRASPAEQSTVTMLGAVHGNIGISSRCVGRYRSLVEKMATQQPSAVLVVLSRRRSVRLTAIRETTAS